MSLPRLAPLLAILTLAACSKAPPPDEGARADGSESAATESPSVAPPGDADSPAPPPPGDPDPGAASAPTVENTHWRLVEVAGQAVAAPAERPEPHIVLFGDEKQAQGFGGCNRMRGAYESDGENLKFGPLASTKMACDYPGNPEDAFMRALAITRRARVVDDQLELYDEAGALLAKLEARAQR